MSASLIPACRRRGVLPSPGSAAVIVPARRIFPRAAAEAVRQGLPDRLGNSASLEAGFDLLELLVHLGLKFLRLRNLEMTGVEDVEWIAAKTEFGKLLVVEQVK